MGSNTQSTSHAPSQALPERSGASVVQAQPSSTSGTRQPSSNMTRFFEKNPLSLLTLPQKGLAFLLLNEVYYVRGAGTQFSTTHVVSLNNLRGDVWNSEFVLDMSFETLIVARSAASTMSKSLAFKTGSSTRPPSHVREALEMIMGCLSLLIRERFPTPPPTDFFTRNIDGLLLAKVMSSLQTSNVASMTSVSRGLRYKTSPELNKRKIARSMNSITTLPGKGVAVVTESSTVNTCTVYYVHGGRVVTESLPTQSVLQKESLSRMSLKRMKEVRDMLDVMLTITMPKEHLTHAYARYTALMARTREDTSLQLILLATEVGEDAYSYFGDFHIFKIVVGCTRQHLEIMIEFMTGNGIWMGQDGGAQERRPNKKKALPR